MRTFSSDGLGDIQGVGVNRLNGSVKVTMSQERYKVGSLVSPKRTIRFSDGLVHYKGRLYAVTASSHAYFNVMWHDYVLRVGEVPLKGSGRF